MLEGSIGYTDLMNTTQELEIHWHKGYTYVSQNGHFYKGCQRCGGTGHYSFDGNTDICYLCRNGMTRLGDAFVDEAAAKKWCEAKAKAKARRDAKKEAERLAKLAVRQEAWDKLAASHPAVWAMLSKAANLQVADGSEYTYVERNSFVAKMAEQLWHLDEWNYTERMLTVLSEIAAKREKDEEVPKTPAPVGRVVVTGTVISTKVTSGQYGDQFKLTIQDDRGFRVYVSTPRAQIDEAYGDFVKKVDEEGLSLYDFGAWVWFMGADHQKNNDFPGVNGRRITLTATLSPSQDDPSFAFGSRPTKGAWL